MPEKTNSIAPVEIKKSGISFNIRWKFIASVIGVILGGGTVAGLATTVGIGSSVASDFDTFKSAQGYEHDKIDKTLAGQDKRAASQDAKIEDINKVVTSVQTTQQRDVSRTEARRLTEKIKDRDERESTYDRLYELNLKRLQRGADPCGDVSCD
jgi:uncharacterized coiled-coil protein SlyX